MRIWHTRIVKLGALAGEAYCGVEESVSLGLYSLARGFGVNMDGFGMSTHLPELH
jgi:hypothetical protein